MTINALHESIKAFLAGHSFISESEAALPGFPLVVENAYKSFALNRLGLHPQLVPANIHQVDQRILDDALWSYSEDGQAPVKVVKTETNPPVPMGNATSDGVQTEAPTPAPVTAPVAAPTPESTTVEEDDGDDVTETAPATVSAPAPAEETKPEVNQGPMEAPKTDMVFEVASAPSTPAPAPKTSGPKGK